MDEKLVKRINKSHCKHFEVRINDSPFAIHFDYFVENFSLIFMKFVNQFSIVNHSFNIFIEYCFTRETAKSLNLFAKMSFSSKFNGKLLTFI